jgi:hypothetical protein
MEGRHSRVPDMEKRLMNGGIIFSYHLKVENRQETTKNKQKPSIS